MKLKKQIVGIAVFALAAVSSQAALLAYYPFDTDGSATVGTAADLGVNASISATAQRGAGSLSLSGGSASDTAGADGAVSGNSFSWASDDTRTVAFWMKANAGDVGDGNATLISLGSGTAAGNRFDLNLSGNALRLEVQTGGVTSGAIVADGSWHHVTVVVPANAATVASTKYYIDGVYGGTFTGSSIAIATGAGPLRMGDSYQGLTRDYKGLLDEVRLYDEALSDLEIAALAGIPPVSAAKPNVILIICDDLGYGDIYNLFQHTRDNGAGGGVSGDGVRNGSEEAFIYTPGIDRMAAEGARLTRHYTSAPVCAPARGSLLQGRDQGHANIRNNSFDKIISDNHTLGTLMKQAGYYTACVGKWGVGGTTPTASGRPNNRGFDYFYGYIKHGNGHQHYPGNGGTVVEQTTPVTTGLDHAYTTDLWTARTKQLIQDRHAATPNTPFFIYVAYDAPHAQLQVPTQAYPAGKGISGGLTWPLNTNSGVDNSWTHPDYASLGTAAKHHATMVRRIDNGIDDILQTLRDLGIHENTLVVFTSDNGTHNEKGSGGTIYHNPRNFDSYGEFEGIKRDHWEGGIRMPTFAWWPTKIGDDNAATPGVDSTRPSAFWDWMPTFAEVAETIPPAWSSGVSLLPELTGSGVQQDKGYLYFEYSYSGSTPSYADFPNHGGAYRGEMQTLFMDDSDGKRYKGVRYNTTSHAVNFKIYDVDLDPDEGSNLAASKTALQQKMKDKVLRVRTDGDYSRPYSGENVPAVTLSTVTGLNYKAFTGIWDWVPETDYLTPVASGECAGLDLSVRTQDEDIALEYTGYINIPSDGVYTFHMTTDSTVAGNTSGGMLWIHDAHIIDDDFNHSGASKSGSARLAAGLHPIRVLYKHASGNHDLALQYSGPGIALQAVPNTSLRIEGVLPPGPPVGVDDAATTTGSSSAPGASVLMDVLANDTDDGTPSPLSISGVGSPLAGTAVVESSKIRYTPEEGFFGVDHFDYTLSDGQDSSTASVTVDVAASGDDYWYPLNEASGLTAFEAGGGRPATLSGFTSDPAQWVGGKLGNAVLFDGSDDHLSIDGYTGILGTSSRTVSAWIKTTGSGQYPVIAWGPNANGQKWTFLVQGGTLRIEVTGGYRQGTTVVNDGNWHHVACTFAPDTTPDVEDAILYVDGVPQTSASSTPQAIQTSASLDVRIGSDVQGRFFNGSIDDARIYPRALSAGEITDLVNQTAGDSDGKLWFLRNLGNAQPLSADWVADKDGDGHSNLAAYALGGSPHWLDTEMEPLFTATTGGFDYVYNRRLALGPSNYILQTTSSLTNTIWSAVAGATATPHPSLPEYEVTTVPLSTAGQTNGFYRLKITY